MAESSNLTKDIRLPFDLYDFFGYLFPGTFLGFGCYVLLNLNGSNALSSEELLTRFNEFSGVLSVGTGVLLLFIVLVVLYLLGHIVGSIGSLVLEKYLVKGILGYPSDYYLRQRNLSDTSLSQIFYKWIFVSFVLALALGVCTLYDDSFVKGFGRVSSCVVVLLLSRMIILLVREWIVLPVKVKWGDKTLVVRTWSGVRFWAKKALEYPTNYLIDLPARVLFGSTGVLYPFDKTFVARFEQKFKSDFSMDFRSAGTNGFWLCYVFVVKNLPSSVPVIRNFLHMYSFARNISTACFLLVGLQLVLRFVFGMTASSENQPYIVGSSIAFLSVGVLMLFRYFYIYASYYTKYLFRAYLVTQEATE